MPHSLRPFTVLAFCLLAACSGSRHEPPGTDASTNDTPASRLPTGVHLDPAGRSIAVGNMPLGMIASSDGRYLVVSLSGWREQGIEIVDRTSGRVTQRLPQRGAFLGLAWSRDGGTLYASAGSADVIYVYSFQAGRAALGDSIALDAPESKTARYPAGISLSSDGNRLYVAENLDDSLAVIDLATRRVVQRVATGPYPYDVAVAPSRVYVSAWGADFVSAFDVSKESTLVARHPIDAGRHPSALALSKNGERLYVVSASTDRVAVVDTRAGRVLSCLHDAPPGNVGEGSTPNALALSDDGRRLFVAEADANAVSVFELSAESAGDSTARGTDRLGGRIPVEWYPCGIVVTGDSLCVVNGKGRGTGPNPKGLTPNKRLKEIDKHLYTLGQLNGTVCVVAAPHEHDALSALTQRVSHANGWDVTADTKPRHYPPFEHVIYIIKENRTYDQLLGDLTQADGDTSLVFFGRRVTPNHHALAERFGIFDRFFVNAEVSYQGHPWSTAAYVTDFLEKTTHDVYRGTRAEHDDSGDADDPAAGYVWDAAVKKGITLRNYGENTEPTPADAAGRMRARAVVPSLAPYTNPLYPPSSLSISDQRRADVWIDELHQFEKTGRMPALEIIHLPRDHTAGLTPGGPTPAASVADNDLALGRMVEALSQSPFWKNTVMFVLEDDAQAGSDHVDSHRSVALVVSAWNRAGVYHRFFNTTDVLATIEEILGLEPMSQFDRFGRPLREIWAGHADTQPYLAILPVQSLKTVNVADSRDARASAQMDFSEADRIDDDELNRILWRTLKGARPYPAPARVPLQELARDRW
jgi:YVTN family beta-propeller protein